MSKGVLADDVLLWTIGNRTYSGRLAVKYRLESTLETTSGWYRANRLKLNASKTQALRLSLCNEDHSVRIVFQGITLEWSDHLKYLGVHFDKKLKWKKQLEAISSKVESRLSGLRRLRGKEHQMPSQIGLCDELAGLFDRVSISQGWFDDFTALDFGINFV